ncbi:MAG: two-component system sensor histidine kinase NtrB, partial [Pseudomonadales bacterium]
MGSREKTRRMTRPDYNIYQDRTLAQLGITQLIRSASEDIEVDIPVFEYRKDSDPESDPDRLWLKITVFPLRAADGSAGEMVVIYQDRTSEKLAEQERAELNAYILQGQKLEGLGSMARGIAHDFNNLLTPVLGNADILQQALELDDDQHRMMESIKSAAKRAADLCDQMLTYGGEGTQDWQPTDLSTEITSLSELIRSSVSQKVLLQRYFDPKLPKVLADRTQLRSIILNLLINASEALGENPGEIQLITGTRTLTESESRRLLPDPNLPTGDYVYIEVSDNGAGMTKEVQARLFDPFFTTKFNGRGLGLSAVLGIVGDHQGGVAFTSSPGQGTTFVIYFPAIAA